MLVAIPFANAAVFRGAVMFCQELPSAARR